MPTFAELAEVACNPHALAGFHDWCQRNRRFALWTREAIDALADYLRDQDHRSIVEVGAGRGDLTWHLARAGVEIVATDAGRNALAGFTLPAYRAISPEMWENVRALDYRAALDVLRPDCVICSWMPPDEDWTPDLRSQEGLREYILIWELRGTTGGASAFAPNPGWRHRDLLGVEPYLVGRTDQGLPGLGLTQYTKATAFLRSES